MKCYTYCWNLCCTWTWSILTHTRMSIKHCHHFSTYMLSVQSTQGRALCHSTRPRPQLSSAHGSSISSKCMAINAATLRNILQKWTQPHRSGILHKMRSVSWVDHLLTAITDTWSHFNMVLFTNWRMSNAQFKFNIWLLEYIIIIVICGVCIISGVRCICIISDVWCMHNLWCMVDAWLWWTHKYMQHQSTAS